MFRGVRNRQGVTAGSYRCPTSTLRADHPEHGSGAHDRGQTVRWGKQLQRRHALPGIGPLTDMALVAAWHRGKFCSVSASIAFMNADLRVRESGQWRRQRKLTKKADPALRRLLFNGAVQGRRKPLWEPYDVSFVSSDSAQQPAVILLYRRHCECLPKPCFSSH